ncbi:MAG: hypothetical protein V1662_03235 [Candidatus Omnitrophota bacterium]
MPAIEELEQKIDAFSARIPALSLDALSAEEKFLFYNYLCRKYPSVMDRVDFDGFEKDPIVGDLLKGLRGEEFYLSGPDIRDLIGLSLAFDERVLEYVNQRHPGDSLWITSVRELQRLHREYVSRYISSRSYQGDKLRVKYTLQYFILCAITFYGDMFGEEVDEFKKILIAAINEGGLNNGQAGAGKEKGYFGLFVRLSLGDESLQGISLPELIDSLLDTSFSALGQPQDPGLLWGVEEYQRTYYSILRKIETGYPGLFIISPFSAGAFDLALEQIQKDESGKSEVYRFGLSYYSDRSEYFGMNVPLKEGGVKFLPGILPKLIERAREDKERQIFLVADDIEAARGSFRVEFNAPLWERIVVIPELGRRYRVPRNLHIIFTTGEDSRIDDAAICDRLVRGRAGRLSVLDTRKLLENRFGLSVNQAQRLSALSEQLNKAGFQQEQLFSVEHLIFPAIYARERARGDAAVLAEEVYRYFALRFRYHRDRQKFNQIFTGIFGQIEKSWERSEIVLGEKGIIADGVEAEAGAEFINRWQENPGKSFTDILLQYHYVAGRYEEAAIAQFFRQRKYADKFPVSNFTVLMGLSGEGKTQLTDVLARILGYKHLPFTFHKKSQPEELTGGIVLGQEGFRIENETGWTRAEREAGWIINYSEANSVLKQAMCYYLSPEFRGADKRILSEIPAEDTLFYENLINRKNLHIVDVNPDDFRAREELPKPLLEYVHIFWMGYDYSADDAGYQAEVKAELEFLARKIFEFYFPELGEKELKGYARSLSGIYYIIQRGLSTGVMNSLYQVLTRRDLIRAVKLFRCGRVIRNLDLDTSYKRAVKAVFWGQALENNVKDGIQKVLKDTRLWIDWYDTGEVFEDARAAKLGHLLVNSNQEFDGIEFARGAAGDSPRHYMCVGDFTDLDSLTCGVGVNEETKTLRAYPGTYLKLIAEAQNDPARLHYLLMENFHRLNADTAVGSNESLQDKVIRIPGYLLDADNQAADSSFAIPENLLFVFTSYIKPEPALKELLPMSGAELSRLFVISPQGGLTAEKIAAYLTRKAERAGWDKRYLPAVIGQAVNIWQRYNLEQEAGAYPHNRLGCADLDEYFGEILKLKEEIAQAPELINRIAYYTLGIGLRDEYTKDITPRDYDIEYVEREEREETGNSQVKKIYLKAGRTEYPTQYLTKDEAQNPLTHNYTVPIAEILEVYEGIFSAWRQGRNVIFLEGFPGRGKTRLAEDLSERLGIGPARFKKVSAFKEIELWDFLGRIEETSPGRYRLTCAKQENKFISEFLDYLENGGVFCFDEGNDSQSAVEILEFLMQVIRREEIDLGLYFNGIEIGQRKVKVHPEFKVFVTFNPADSTKARRHIPLPVDWYAKKIWVKDRWKKESWLKFIGYYLDNPQALSEEEKERLINLHLYMRYIMEETFKERYPDEQAPDAVARFEFSKFKEKYTAQYGVSPREIIRILSAVSQGFSLYEGIILNYLFQFNNMEDFEAGTAVVESVFPGFGKFLDQWMKDTGITRTKDKIKIGTIETPEGFILTEQKSVNKETQPFLVENAPEVLAMKALLLNIIQDTRRKKGIPTHTLINSAQGSYPKEFLRYFAYFTGMDLDIFDGTPYVNSVEIAGGKTAVFGPLAENGIAGNTNGRQDVPGFILGHLVEEREYQEHRAEILTRPHRILYLPALEEVIDEELEILSDFWNTGRIEQGGKTYILPENAHIVIESNQLREKKFTGPFFNRFQKIALFASIEREDVCGYLDKYYAGLTAEEKGLIYDAAVLLWYLDMGFYDDANQQNPRRKEFSRRYGFSIKEAYDLAELVLWEKQSQKQAGAAQIDSVRAVLKAVMRLYGQALDEITDGKDAADRDVYLQELLWEVFNYEGIGRNTLRVLEQEIRAVERIWTNLEIDKKQLEKEPYLLPCGIKVSKEDGSYRVETPVNKYKYTGGEAVFSDGLKARENQEKIILSLGLLKSIGDADTGITEENKLYRLPPEEVAPGDYIRHSGVINEINSLQYWASRRVGDTSGRVRGPRPVIYLGPTGGGKSTNIRNMGAVLGAPVCALFAFEGMEPDNVFLQMSIAFSGKERHLELGLKEFFSHFGRINGNYYYPEGKLTHALKKYLFIDEANVCGKILYCFRPLLRGARKFVVYYLGERFSVELDPEVMIVAAGNPAETYTGRKAFPLQLLEDCVKVWVPVLHDYNKSERVDRDDLVEILFGLHKRRMKELDTDIRQAEGGEISPDKRFLNNTAPVIKLAPVEGVTYIRRRRLEPGEITPEVKPAQPRTKTAPQIRKEILRQGFTYSIAKIEQGLKNIQAMNDNLPKYLCFLDEILRDYLLALSDGEAEAAEYAQANPAALTARVLAELEPLDGKFYQKFKQLVDLYAEGNPKFVLIKRYLHQLGEIILEKNRGLEKTESKRFLFIFPIEHTGRDEAHILVKVEPVLAELAMSEAELAAKRVNVEKYREKLPIITYMVYDNPFIKGARGVYSGGNYRLALKKAMEGAPVDLDTHFQWVARHENSHSLNELRWLAEEIQPHKNIELFSMLEPAIFGPERRRYIEMELKYLLDLVKDKNSYYTQAAKGIFNGFLRVLKEEDKSKRGELQNLEEITDAFEQERIDPISEIIRELSEEEMERIGLILYKDAWSKKYQGEYYLSSAKGGKYPLPPGAKGTAVSGDVISELTEGPAFGPEVDMGDMDEETVREIEKQIGVEREDGKKSGKTPEVDFSEAGEEEEDGSGGKPKGEGKEEGKPGEKGKNKKGGKPGKGGKKGQYKPGVIEKGWLEKPGGSWFERNFIAEFTQEPVQEEVHSRTGRQVDWKAVLKGSGSSRKLFIKNFEIETNPQLVMVLVDDTSGSIGYKNLLRTFTNITMFFINQLHRVTKKNKGVFFSLGSISDRYDSVFGFDQCRDGEILSAAPEKVWKVGTGGGINTIELIIGLRDLFAKPGPHTTIRNKLVIVNTDGGETSEEAFFETLNHEISGMRSRLAQPDNSGTGSGENAGLSNKLAVYQEIQEMIAGWENEEEGRITNGQFTYSQTHIKKLKRLVKGFEKRYGVDVVFIGIDTKDVTNYSKYILFNKEPQENDLKVALTKIARQKALRGFLPQGDLVDKLGINTETTVSVQAMQDAKWEQLLSHCLSFPRKRESRKAASSPIVNEQKRDEILREVSKWNSGDSSEWR